VAIRSWMLIRQSERFYHLPGTPPFGWTRRRFRTNRRKGWRPQPTTVGCRAGRRVLVGRKCSRFFIPCDSAIIHNSHKASEIDTASEDANGIVTALSVQSFSDEYNLKIERV
jgi:hypothetical protein